MKNNTRAQIYKEVTDFMNAAMPSWFAGAASYKGIQELPGVLGHYAGAIDSYLPAGQQGGLLSLKSAYQAATAEVLATPLGNVIASNPEYAGAVWSMGVCGYIFYRLYILPPLTGTPEPKTPPAPRIEPQLPW